jgi:hypothetical protein
VNVPVVVRQLTQVVEGHRQKLPHLLIVLALSQHIHQVLRIFFVLLSVLTGDVAQDGLIQLIQPLHLLICYHYGANTLVILTSKGKVET